LRGIAVAFSIALVSSSEGSWGSGAALAVAPRGLFLPGPEGDCLSPLGGISWRHANKAIWLRVLMEGVIGRLEDSDAQRVA
jgi:hypothetical protein